MNEYSESKLFFRISLYLSHIISSLHSPAQTGPVDKKRLKLRDQLKKAESSLTTQIRTEKIDFASFLYRRKVPGIETASCRCG
jgi:hypothetical protein